MHKSIEETIIVGGGLAGLVCAIDFRKRGRSVTVVEKNIYPLHKVCGEFISNEVRSYLTALDLDIESLEPTQISRFSISSGGRKKMECALPLGGFGLSRFKLDHFLFEKARQTGCRMVTDTVEGITFDDDRFSVTTQNNGVLSATLVIGAFGKRSAIDQKLKRKFIFRKSPWLAVKGHYRGELKDDIVSLYLFKGGYCGVSKIEDNLINICYLVDYTNFRAYKNINEFQQQVMYKNPQLKEIFENLEPVFQRPLSISQISFEKKEQVLNHILMIGDTAGLIHPLCGNGMAMAIHSAKICAELAEQFLMGSIKNRAILETKYKAAWKANFQNRLNTGRILSKILKKEKLSDILLHLMFKFPPLLRMIIKNTHGKPNM